MITLFIFSENVQKLSTLVTTSVPLQKVISWAKFWTCDRNGHYLL